MLSRVRARHVASPEVSVLPYRLSSMGHGLDDVEGSEVEVVLKKALARERGRGSPLWKDKERKHRKVSYVRLCRWLRIAWLQKWEGNDSVTHAPAEAVPEGGGKGDAHAQQQGEQRRREAEAVDVGLQS